MTKSTVVTFFLLLTFGANAQPDSLWNVYRTTENDSLKADILITLSYDIRPKSVDSATVLARRAYQLSDREHTAQQGELHYLFATLYYFSGDYDLAVPHADTALAAFRTAGNMAGQAKTYSRLGRIKEYQGNYDGAIEEQMKAVHIRDSLGLKSELAGSYSCIGIVYNLLDQPEEALKFYQKSIDIYEEEGNVLGQASTLNNMANIYSDYGKDSLAIASYQKAYDVAMAHDEINNASMYLNNLGEVYLKQNQLDKALELFHRAYDIRKSVNNKLGMAYSLESLGHAYGKKGDVQKAETYLDLAVKYCIEVGSYKKLQYVYEIYSLVYEINGMTDEAFDYYKKYSHIKDSIRSASITQKIHEIEVKYESAKKEKQIALLHKEKQVQQAELDKQFLQKMVIAVVLLFVVLFALYIFIQYRNKHKLNQLIQRQNDEIKEKNEELNMQNEEILTQSEELSLKNQILEQKNTEINDSISAAERIQMAFFMSEERDKQLLPEHFVLFRPKDVVSGDFYWSHVSEENGKKYIYISVVDCTGHGVPGALMSMLGLSLIKEIMNETPVISPEKLLTTLRRKLIKELSTSAGREEIKEGMDMSVVRLDLATGELLFAGANNPLYVVSEGILTTIEATRQSISYHREYKDMEVHRLALKPGSMVYLFSDGYADQFGGPKNKKMGYKRFRALLEQHADQPTGAQQVALAEFLDDWKGREEQLDDICVIGVRIDQV